MSEYSMMLLLGMTKTITDSYSFREFGEAIKLEIIMVILTQ